MSNRILSDDQERRLYALYRDLELPISLLARRFGVSHTTAKSVIDRQANPAHSSRSAAGQPAS